MLNPALAAATAGVSAWRKLMYSLVWQSVMWRPGKLRFLIGMKNPLPIRPTATARKYGPLRGRAGRQIRDFSRATPSFRGHPATVSHPDRRALLIPSVAQQPIPDQSRRARFAPARHAFAADCGRRQSPPAARARQPFPRFVIVLRQWGLLRIQ